MTSLQLFLMVFGWMAAIPTILFCALWVGLKFVESWQKRSATADSSIGEDGADGDELATSIDEADEVLADGLSPACSPLNRRAQ
ncbi:MAG: hypothetical protein V7609_2127 [Verrucomicrobiota bacterium]